LFVSMGVYEGWPAHVRRNNCALVEVNVYSTETRLPFAIMRVSPLYSKFYKSTCLAFRDLYGEDQKDQKPVGECPNTRFVAATAVQDHTRENDRPLLFSGSETGGSRNESQLTILFSPSLLVSSHRA
jgi:hypothetical protein